MSADALAGLEAAAILERRAAIAAWLERYAGREVELTRRSSATLDADPMRLYDVERDGLHRADDVWLLEDLEGERAATDVEPDDSLSIVLFDAHGCTSALYRVRVTR